MKLIAELCQNHRGEPALMRRMVEEAAAAGATHVKLQNILASPVAMRPQFEEGVEVEGRTLAIRRPWAAEVERPRGLELDPDTVAEFVALSRSLGVVPMTTCFTRGDVELVASQGFEAIKVASYDCASYPLLRELAERFDHMVVSTGATFDDEIAHAAEVLRGRTEFAFLHAVTIYPTPLDELHLARMERLRRHADVVGFSDHTLHARDGNLASRAALALGAEVIERHFTVLGPEETRDGPVSVDPVGLAELAAFAALTLEERRERLAAEGVDLVPLLGDADRTLSDAELLNRDYYRGRFMTPRAGGSQRASEMIANWEETPW